MLTTVNCELFTANCLACQAAAFAPPSAETLTLRAALRGNQAEINRFYGVAFGMISQEEFYGSELIQSTLTAAPPG